MTNNRRYTHTIVSRIRFMHLQYSDTNVVRNIWINQKNYKHLCWFLIDLGTCVCCRKNNYTIEQSFTIHKLNPSWSDFFSLNSSTTLNVSTVATLGRRQLFMRMQFSQPHDVLQFYTTSNLCMHAHKYSICVVTANIHQFYHCNLFCFILYFIVASYLIFFSLQIIYSCRCNFFFCSVSLRWDLTFV